MAELPISLAVRLGPGEELRRIVVVLDHREIAQTRGIQLIRSEAPSPALAPGETAYRVSITVPPEDSSITVRAETASGYAESVSLRLRWGGERKTDFVVPPKLYVLAVGIANYLKSDLRLSYPAKDAKDLATVFGLQNGLLYRQVTARVLMDQAASKAAILDGLEWIQRQTTVRDVAVVILAGHGINDRTVVTKMSGLREIPGTCCTIKRVNGVP